MGCALRTLGEGGGWAERSALGREYQTCGLNTPHLRIDSAAITPLWRGSHADIASAQPHLEGHIIIPAIFCARARQARAICCCATRRSVPLLSSRALSRVTARMTLWRASMDSGGIYHSLRHSQRKPTLRWYRGCSRARQHAERRARACEYQQHYRYSRAATRSAPVSQASAILCIIRASAAISIARANRRLRYFASRASL